MTDAGVHPNHEGVHPDMIMRGFTPIMRRVIALDMIAPGVVALGVITTFVRTTSGPSWLRARDRKLDRLRLQSLDVRAATAPTSL